MGGFSFLDNHLSGSHIASDADQKLTKKVVKTDKLLDMPVHDHIILTSESYLAMADEGLM